MNLTNRLAPWNALLFGSMLIMLGAFVYDKVVPMPKIEVKGSGIAEQEKRLRQQANALYLETKESEQLLNSRLWIGDSKLIGPRAMATATQIASKRQLKLAAFRPQKSVQEGTLVRFPFVVSLEGTYPQIIGFVRDLENPSNKLVVNIVQIASTDGSSSAVNAVINLWAFQAATESDKKSTTRKVNAKN